MTIESSPYKLDSSHVDEPREKLVAVAKEKGVQKLQLDGKQAVSGIMLSHTHDLSVIVPTRNEHANVWPLLESLHGFMGKARQTYSRAYWPCDICSACGVKYQPPDLSGRSVCWFC